jgi:hypothetical protein
MFVKDCYIFTKLVVSEKLLDIKFSDNQTLDYTVHLATGSGMANFMEARISFIRLEFHSEIPE